MLLLQLFQSKYFISEYILFIYRQSKQQQLDTNTGHWLWHQGRDEPHGAAAGRHSWPQPAAAGQWHKPAVWSRDCHGGLVSCNISQHYSFQSFAPICNRRCLVFAFFQFVNGVKYDCFSLDIKDSSKSPRNLVKSFKSQEKKHKMYSCQVWSLIATLTCNWHYLSFQFERKFAILHTRAPLFANRR